MLHLRPNVFIIFLLSLGLLACSEDTEDSSSVVIPVTRDMSVSQNVDMKTQEEEMSPPMQEMGVDMAQTEQDMTTASSTCNDGTQNGKETGIDCGGTCPNVCASCNPDAKRVFVTSKAFFGGLRKIVTTDDAFFAADTLCTMSATEAGLGGSWKAWISSREGSAKVRFKDVVGPWYLVDQCTKVTDSIDALLASGPEVSIDRDELGAFLSSPSYWTGTDPQGESTTFDCNRWGSTAASREGTIGEPTGNARATSWTNSRSESCPKAHGLLCFEL